VRLREAGLVAWEDGKTGTLRPLVGRVDMHRASAPTP
jgi:hypothetical protein